MRTCVCQLPTKIQSTDEAENLSERQSLFAKLHGQRKGRRLAQNHLRARSRCIRRRQQKNPPSALARTCSSSNSCARSRNFRRQPRQPNRLAWSHSPSRCAIYFVGAGLAPTPLRVGKAKPASPRPSPDRKRRQPPSPSQLSHSAPRSAPVPSIAPLQSPHSS